MIAAAWAVVIGAGIVAAFRLAVEIRYLSDRINNRRSRARLARERQTRKETTMIFIVRREDPTEGTEFVGSSLEHVGAFLVGYELCPHGPAVHHTAADTAACERDRRAWRDGFVIDEWRFDSTDPLRTHRVAAVLARGLGT